MVNHLAMGQMGQMVQTVLYLAQDLLLLLQVVVVEVVQGHRMVLLVVLVAEVVVIHQLKLVAQEQPIKVLLEEAQSSMQIDKVVLAVAVLLL